MTIYTKAYTLILIFTNSCTFTLPIWWDRYRSRAMQKALHFRKTYDTYPISRPTPAPWVGPDAKFWICSCTCTHCCTVYKPHTETKKMSHVWFYDEEDNRNSKFKWWAMKLNFCYSLYNGCMDKFPTSANKKDSIRRFKFKPFNFAECGSSNDVNSRQSNLPYSQDSALLFSEFKFEFDLRN